MNHMKVKKLSLLGKKEILEFENDKEFFDKNHVS